MKCGTCGRFASGMCLLMDCETAENKAACPEYIEGKRQTCGECCYFEYPAGQCAKVIEYNNCHITDKACEYFEPKPTNGDVTRQMSNAGLAEFLRDAADDIGNNNRSVEDILAWLNAPAESEGDNG